MLSVPIILRSGRWILRALCLSFGLFMVAQSALAEIAQSPLFLPIPPPPNIMYMLDNSGSMVWGTVTGQDATSEFNADKTQRAYYASQWNQIYYNPALTYIPAVQSNASSMGNARPDQALLDPFLDPQGARVDVRAVCYSRSSAPRLPLYNRASFAGNNNCSPTTATGNTALARYAFYYNWVGTGAPQGKPSEDTALNYQRVDILPNQASYPRASTRTDCAAASCSYAEEIQNFANWFSYYRTRMLTTKTAMGIAFSGINDRFRVGFGTINENRKNFVPISAFDTQQKAAWYAKLYAIDPNGGTPLIDALNQVGQYYMGKGMNGAPSGTPDPIQLQCQANYAIIATDGYWNGPIPSIGNYDTRVTSLPAPVPYDPVSGTALKVGENFPRPFYKGPIANANTLADTAMKYWISDIGVRDNKIPSTVGKVTATATDPATWQHMTTHTIGLGANGSLVYRPDYKTATSGDYAAIKSGAKDWPKPRPDDPTAIDDLWHTAVNGHGSYFSAKNPQLLQAGLNSILSEIGKASGSGGGFTYPGNSIPGANNAVAYLPSFDSGAWSGHLKAYRVGADGSLDDSMLWDAATLLPAPELRNIVTWNPISNTPKNFTWPNLSTGTDSQQAYLGSAEVLNYLRGDASLEQATDGSGGHFRHRPNKLGDIINAAPIYVQNSDFGYSLLPTIGVEYTRFLAAKAGRKSMLYVGANDGMLHGFDTQGSEKFAFIPNSVYSNLKNLSNPNYGHHYFVDGPLAEGDAYLGDGWKNILLGSTGAGAQSIFALDVSKPELLGVNTVLWEYNSTQTDPDLGHVLGAPAVVLLANNRWAAIFGNGYDSGNGHAILYLVDIGTGELIQKIDTGSVNTPNGLSTPGLLFNASRQLIAAYAGDLQGNLWKFDLSANNSMQWNAKLLFSAKNNSNTAQPIVQAPVLAPHPLGGYIVMFGTGKYFATQDMTNIDTQSLYGVWDQLKQVPISGRSQLQEQTLTTVTSATGTVLGRTLSRHTVAWGSQRGWYIDFPDKGERVVGNLQIINDIILLSSSLQPNTTDPCAGGGASQLLGANFLTGAYSQKFHLIVPGTPAGIDLSSAAIPGTIGTAVPIPNPNVTEAGCINTVGSDGVIHCLQYKTTGVALRALAAIGYQTKLGMIKGVTMRRRNGGLGFTLMELMIVLLIVGVIAAMAVPNYMQYVQRGYRAQAMASLLQNANWMQQQFTINNQFPKKLSENSSSSHYTISVLSQKDDSFTLQAVPLNQNDKCGTFLLDDTGKRDTINGSIAASDCWAGR